MVSRRQLLPRIREALQGSERAAALAGLEDIAARTRLGPLFSLLLDREPLLRWRAVTAFGAAMGAVAAAHLEAARDVWRNLMWRVNEESGNIAWGIPECMGETLAVCPALAADYHRILLSYVQNMEGDCTFIDHAPLRQGAWWAVARVAAVAPELVRAALPELTAALTDGDAVARGLACLALSRLHPDPTQTLLAGLTALQADATSFALYDGWDLVVTSVADQATAALAACRRCL